jgi:imidazolonepropionase-like amidohydrolase
VPVSSLAIVRRRVVPIVGEPIERGIVLVEEGRVTAVGDMDIEIPRGHQVVTADGQHVLPGFIDVHTHLCVSEEAEGWAGEDMNEMTDPNTAHVRALDAINPADLGFRDAIAGGCWRSTSTRAPPTRSAGRPWRSSAGDAPSTRWCSGPPAG